MTEHIDTTEARIDPRGTVRGLPDDHFTETGLREPSGDRHSATRELYAGQVERDSEGRPVALGLHLDSRETAGRGTGRRARQTDVGVMLSVHALDRYDPATFRAGLGGHGCADDLIEHYWLDAPARHVEGGPFAFMNGPPGAGKSTFLNHLAIRMLECNGHRLGEKVVWRGSPSRDEWLSLAPWTRLVLPANADVTATLKPKRPTDDPLQNIPLANYVREVVRYEDPVDALAQCRAGGFNVVYPDPSFSGCEALYRQTPSRRVDEVPSRDQLFAPGDPLPHWWVALLLAAVEGRDDTTPIALFWDEIKDIAKQGAKKDSYGSFQKIEELGGDLSADARKRGVAIVGAGHGEVAVNSEWRRKIHYRIHPHNRETPRSAGGLLGFDSTPFNGNVNADKKRVGKGTIFNSENFDEISWKIVSSPISAFDLRVRVVEA